MAGFASAIPLIGGVISGAGNVKANYENKGTKERLRWQLENLRELADPVGASLTEGYAPGGWMRGQARAAARMPVDRQLGQSLQGIRGENWRYGGGEMGRRRWQDARVGGALGYGEADMTGDVQATDTLSRMQALQKGYQSAFAPETVYQNPYAWIEQATKGFGQGYGSGGRF